MSGFSEAIGLFGDCPGDDSPDAQQEWLGVVADGAAQFLRGGGTLSMADWRNLSPEERAVFALVGDKLDAKRSVQFARACRSEMGELSVAAIFDGGDGLVSRALNSLLDKAASSE